VSQQKLAKFARIAVLTTLVAVSIRCAPAQTGTAQPLSALQLTGGTRSLVNSAAARPLALEGIDTGPPQVSLDVVRARIDARRRVVAVDPSSQPLDASVGAVARELSTSGTPAIGTELRLVFATSQTATGKQLSRRLLAVQMGSGAKARRAFRVTDEQDGVDGFYDAGGKPVERVLLRYPVAHLVITSRFSFDRVHPITKKHRPHLGVDFAAPRGTPVIAAGDGVVVAAGWGGAFGRQVRIRHDGELITVYAHLDRFAAGIKIGSEVHRGDVIGTVGASGLASGNHLHFALIRKGKFVDPLIAALPPVPVLSENLLAELHETVGEAEQVLAAAAASDDAVRVAHASRSSKAR
jgi:murein DD-endopeptidase MepM/ murein hydrolase activator NlpD